MKLSKPKRQTAQFLWFIARFYRVFYLPIIFSSKTVFYSNLLGFSDLSFGFCGLSLGLHGLSIFKKKTNFIWSKTESGQFFSKTTNFERFLTVFQSILLSHFSSSHPDCNSNGRQQWLPETKWRDGLDVTHGLDRAVHSGRDTAAAVGPTIGEND
jgi:hypothetical protein